MNSKLKTAKRAVLYIGAALLIIAAFVMYNEWQKEKRLRKLETAALEGQVQASLKETTTLKNANGKLVAENKAITAAHASDLKKYTARIFELEKRDARRVREVQSYTRLIQQYRDSIKLAHWTDEPDSPKMVFVPVYDTGSIKVPKPFSYQDSAFSVAGKVLKNGVMIDSIQVQGAVHLRTFTERSGFLGLKRTTKVQALSDNPRITITGLSTITAPNRSNWWQRWGKPVAAAAAALIIQNQIR